MLVKLALMVIIASSASMFLYYLNIYSEAEVIFVFLASMAGLLFFGKLVKRRK